MESEFQAKHILVVEDQAEIRTSLAMMLQMENFVVHQAPNGEVALELLQELTPDLIISDINMPKMNGIAFNRALRQNPAWVAIPFIFLTANDSPEDIREGRMLGVEDYLTKPVADDELLTIVSSRLQRSTELRLAQIGQAYLETVRILANSIEGRDPYTYGHVERVTTYARLLAEEMKWPREHMRMLEFGALLHDIGKIIVPDQVLKKPGPLTDTEWELMKQHPMAGAKIVREIHHLRSTVPYILYHHERWDGTGYPEGLAGRKIPIEGRLLAIADVYDALTSERPYRHGRPPKEVLQFLKFKAGVHFDPDLVPLFIRALARRLPGLLAKTRRHVAPQKEVVP